MSKSSQMSISDAMCVAFVVLGISEREWDLVFDDCDSDEQADADRAFAKSKLFDYFGDELLDSFSVTARTECLILQVFGANPAHKSTVQAMPGYFTPDLNSVYNTLGVKKCKEIANVIKTQGFNPPNELISYLSKNKEAL